MELSVVVQFSLHVLILLMLLYNSIEECILEFNILMKSTAFLRETVSLSLTTFSYDVFLY